jgi:hypothetical protein
MNTKIALKFIDAINEADTDKIRNLMSEDHKFIDPQDNSMNGKENMIQAWNEYFRIFPDYRIEVLNTFEKDEDVCFLGYASGTYLNLRNEANSNHWRIPAAWKAIVRDNHIKHWQVYADNIIVLNIINSNK